MVTFANSASPSETREPADATTGARPRILLVEDERLVALDVQRRLTALGYEPIGVAGEGAEALELVRATQPALVLMDIGIQGTMDGVEVARRLRDFADVPVIFVTGNSDEGTLQRAQATHPYSYIIKPIRDRELKISIDAALHHHRLAAELREARDDLDRRVRERTVELEHANHLLQARIAEQARLEQALRLARADAEDASRSKSRFFSQLSHDVRTPMNGIVGMADILAETTLSAGQNKCLDVIRRCAGDLVTTVDEIIEFSDLEAGRLGLKCEETNLRLLLPETLRSVQGIVGVGDVALTCDIAPEVPSTLFLDPLRFAQLLRHLVLFAACSAPHGEVEVQCECLDDGYERAHLHLWIRDNGRAHSVDAQRRLQAVFTRPDPAAGAVLDGVRLGVVISSLLVRLMGGILWLDTLPGSGNTVHCALWLPTSRPQ